MTLIPLLLASVLLFGSVAFAKTGTIIDLGGGIKSYNDNRGVTGNIIDPGNGIQSYNFNVPPPSATLPTRSRRRRLFQLRVSAHATDVAIRIRTVRAMLAG